MRIAWRTGSVYEWTQHWRVAKRLEIDAASVMAVRDWQKAACLNAADKAVLAATDETIDDGRISDPTWIACCEHLARCSQHAIQVGSEIRPSSMVSSVAANTALSAAFRQAAFCQSRTAMTDAASISNRFATRQCCVHS